MLTAAKVERMIAMVRGGGPVNGNAVAMERSEPDLMAELQRLPAEDLAELVAASQRWNCGTLAEHRATVRKVYPTRDDQVRVLVKDGPAAALRRALAHLLAASLAPVTAPGGGAAVAFGRTPAAPPPADPVRAMDRAITKRQAANRAAGRDESVGRIIERIEREEPAVFVAYERAKRDGRR